MTLCRLVRPLSFGFLVAALSFAAGSSALAAKPSDKDADGVDDEFDNCVLNPNPHQENTSADATPEGDVCDRDTINAIIEATERDANGFHVSTPFYRARVLGKRGFSVDFSAEAGMFSSANAGIGVEGAQDQGVLTLAPEAISGLSSNYKLNSRPSVLQSTWQSLVATDLFELRKNPPLRFHFGSGANGVGVGVEVPLAEIPAGNDVALQFALQLPAGWSIDADELGSEGIGRLTVRDAQGAQTIRLSAVQLAAFGHETKLQDTPGKFFGLQRLTEELGADVQVASVPPGNADPVGSNYSGGIEAPLVQTSYTLMENQADSDLGMTQVAGNVVTLVAPAEFIDRNRESSSLMFIGLGISSLTSVEFGTATNVYGRHIVSFDEEAEVEGDGVTIQFEQIVGTFDGAPVPYALLPNQGGTAAIEDWARQQQTAYGCGGCKMTLTGNSTIRFADVGGSCSDLNGGAGVVIGPGGRVGPNHPCLATAPIDHATSTGRCEEGRLLRGWFSADDPEKPDLLTIEGSMSGLACADSDCRVEQFDFVQKRDPNVTDEIALHAVVGLGCAAGSGVRISRNPADGKIVSNVPLDLSSCASPEEIGAGDCRPAPLGTAPGTGICNLEADRVELVGLGANRPGYACRDLTVPSGVGVALGMESGKGRIGPKAFNSALGRCEAVVVPDPAPSVIEGFQVAVSTSGGANVLGATGEPLAFDDPNAVPPIPYCLDKIVVDNAEVGVAVGANNDVELTRCSVGMTQFGSIVVGNGGGNVEDPSTVACREVGNQDGKSCATVVEELACPTCRKNDENFLAVSAAGLSAPTRLKVAQCVLGLDANGEVVSGQNPALPPLNLDPTLTAQELGLTIAGRPASLFKMPVQVGKGPDTISNPALLSIELSGNNIGLKKDEDQQGQASVAWDNKDAAGSDQTSVTAKDNCYKLGLTGVQCASGTVMATAAADSEIQNLNATAQSLASPLAKPAGGDLQAPFKLYSSEPLGTPDPLASSVTVEDPLFQSITDITLLRPLELGLPVDKNGEGVANTEALLNCYEAREDVATQDQVVAVSSQFGVHDVEAVNLVSLCVPAVFGTQGSAVGQVNAFACYQRGDYTAAPEEFVELEDAFETTSSRVKPPPVMVCNPVSVPDLGLAVPGEDVGEDHLACFLISDELAFDGQVVAVRDPLLDAGLVTPDYASLDVVRSRLLCERAKADCETCP